MEGSSCEEEEGIVESENFSEDRNCKGKGKYLGFITFDLDRCQHLAVDSFVLFKKKSL